MAVRLAVVADIPRIVVMVCALRDAIGGITPRYGRSDVAAALLQVGASMDELNVRDGNAVVVLLSDFSRSAAYLGETLPPELEGLGRRASIVTALPAQGTDNVQVVSVTPRRRMVVATGIDHAVDGILICQEISNHRVIHIFLKLEHQ